MKSHMQITERQIYDIWTQSADETTRSAVLVILYTLIQRGWHRDRLIKLFEDIVTAFTQPLNIFGKEVDDLYVEMYLKKYYPEIDLKRIRVRKASLEESRRRHKENSEINKKLT